MSSQFYLSLLPKINQTVKRFGTLYKVRGEALYDEQTMTTSDPVERSVVGLVSDGELLNSTDVTGNISWVGKKVLILTAEALPKQGEQVQVNGRWYPLSKIKEIKPAEVVMLYILDITV